MSHFISRKTAVDRPSRAPVSIKASGDNSTDKKSRSKSRNKIPKSLRNGLENALVNLCDIWFEEIKPHLLRNNIKLHMNEEAKVCGAGDIACPSGARSPAALDCDIEPGCSHLDPGADDDRRRPRSVGCVGCCSTQPTASRAQCRRQPQHPNVLLHHNPSVNALTQCNNLAEVINRKPRKKRKSNNIPQTITSKPLIPRLCRTLSLALELQPFKVPAVEEKSRYQRKYVPATSIHLMPKKIHETADKWTQTEKVGKKYKSRRQPVQGVKYSKGLLSLPDCNVQPLFKQDLIDIISHENTKRLNMIYKRPSIDENIPSIMNLLPLSKPTYRNKTQPWK